MKHRIDYIKIAVLRQDQISKKSLKILKSWGFPTHIFVIFSPVIHIPAFRRVLIQTPVFLSPSSKKGDSFSPSPIKCMFRFYVTIFSISSLLYRSCSSLFAAMHTLPAHDQPLFFMILNRTFVIAVVRIPATIASGTPNPRMIPRITS